MRDAFEIFAALFILAFAALAGFILILVVNPAFWIFITIVFALNALIP